MGLRQDQEFERTQVGLTQRQGRCQNLVDVSARQLLERSAPYHQADERNKTRRWKSNVQWRVQNSLQCRETTFLETKPNLKVVSTFSRKSFRMRDKSSSWKRSLSWGSCSCVAVVVCCGDNVSGGESQQVGGGVLGCESGWCAEFDLRSIRGPWAMPTMARIYSTITPNIGNLCSYALSVCDFQFSCDWATSPDIEHTRGRIQNVHMLGAA